LLIRFLHYGIYILHGEKDDNVPVAQARFMRELLGKFHPDFAYYERPGAGHWWGDECADWTPLFDFLKRHTRPADAGAGRVEFVTANPGISARSHWIIIVSLNLRRFGYAPTERGLVVEEVDGLYPIH
jgi:hypothetical protein